ncbi:hypothetical protein [Flavobacterium sp. MMS24-S5]|uniref:hypothetical protein n=1 Tax=Flavobacterium sp. MMS24-S5 TaxID=3416605 RepID=UPI003D04687A
MKKIMNKIKPKKIVFKKTNIMELDSKQARSIVGGSNPGDPITDPRSVYSIYVEQ